MVQPAPSGPFNFGGQSQQAQPQFSFGGIGSTTQATTAPSLFTSPFSGAAQPSFNFGATATTTSATGFGSTPTTSAPAYNFASATSSAPSFSFGAATTTAPTLSFGSATTTTGPTFSLGAPATTFPSTTTAGGGLFSGTSAPGFGFGVTATTSATPSLFSGFTSTPATGLSGGITSAPTLFGASTTTTPSLGFAQTTTTSTGLSFGGISSTVVSNLSQPTTSAPIGLGGTDIAPASSEAVAGAFGTSKNDKAIKETLIPSEIYNTVETFKKFVQEQKVIREEISRVSSRPIMKVQEDTAALKQSLSLVSSGLQRNTITVSRLKSETAQELKNAEIAQHTKDTPPGLQYDNTSPTEYFQRLVSNFSFKMKMYKQQIEELEQHFASLSNQSSLSAEELMLAMRKIHETFVTSAAQLYSVHEMIQKRKDQFISLRMMAHLEPADVFTEHEAEQIPGTLVHLGPSPFSGLAGSSIVGMPALNQAAQPTGGGILGAGSGQSMLGSGSLSAGLGTSGLFSGGSSGFGGSSLFGDRWDPASGTESLGFGAASSLNAQNKPFQLQKPPPGNKRGKK